MIGGAIKGAGYLVAGMRLLSHPKLRPFVIMPLLINTVVFGLLIWWGIGQMEALALYLTDWLPDWLDWLAWLLWPLFGLSAVLIGFYTFTLVANVVGSPFNGLLSERVEDMMNPLNTRPPGRPLWQEVAIAPMAELRKLVYFIGWAIPLLVLFFIPVINLAAPFLWAAFSAWMLALQYMDYPLGNQRLAFREQRQIMAGRRGLALGFGGAVLAMTLVPVLNFFAMPTAVIGATLMWVEQFPDVARGLREGGRLERPPSA